MRSAVPPPHFLFWGVWPQHVLSLGLHPGQSLPTRAHSQGNPAREWKELGFFQAGLGP